MELILVVTSNSQDIPPRDAQNIMNYTSNGIEISTDEDYSIPWDATVSIRDKNLVIKGDLGKNKGYRAVEVVIESSKLVEYDIQLSVTLKSEHYMSVVTDILDKWRWTWTIKES